MIFFYSTHYLFGNNILEDVLIQKIKLSILKHDVTQ